MPATSRVDFPDAPPPGLRRWAALLAVLAMVTACTTAPVASPTGAPTTAPTGQATDAPATDSPSTSAPATDAATDAPPGEPVTLTAAWTDFGEMNFSTAGSGGDTEKVMLQIQDPLTTVDPVTQEVVGALADSFEISDDLLSWTFHLRQGPEFHDGFGQVTSEDVKYTWEQWMSEESTHGRRDQVARVVGGDINNFEIVDDETFIIHSPTPQVDLPGFLTPYALGMAIDSKRYHDEMGDAANAHPIGTGPFEFVSSIPGEEIVLETNQSYWKTPASYDRLVLKLIEDGAARLLQTQSGDVDVAFLDSDLIGEAEAAGLQLVRVPDVASVYIVLGGSYWSDNTADSLDRDSPWVQADEPEKGLAIRQAMSLAIDRAAILDTIVHGYGTLAHGPLLEFPNNPNLATPELGIAEYNPDAARQKLIEGGYPDGFEVELFQYADDIDTVAIGEAIAGMWEDIGLTVIRNPGEEDLLEEMEDNQETGGIAWVKLSGYNVEPASRLSSFYGADDVGLTMSHNAIDDAYDAMITEPELSERQAIARDLIATLRAEEIGLTMFVSDQIFMAGPRVGSWQTYPGVKDMYGLETITVNP